ncbi:MAG TPA: hypothetical protein VF533_19635 [Solirubrobacteraceae bacterium]|jgi:hypothetical protein
MKRWIAAMAALGAGALAPAGAYGATATVTGDAGQPVPLGGPVTIRQMDWDVIPAFSSEEVSAKRDYSLVVLDPAGQVASNRVDCFPTDTAPLNAFGNYRGNGVYTAVLTTYPDTERSSDACKGQGTEQRLQFTINAFTAVGPLPPGHLRRQAGSFATVPLEVPVQGNPGAGSTELRYARDGVIGPDGGISGISEQAYVSSSTGTATVTFGAPGRYVFVARVGSGSFYSPWSPPVTIDVVSPFDLLTLSIPDSRGPSYKIKAKLNEPTATGRVKLAIAKGRKGGRFHKLGRAKIKRDGVITKRFRHRGYGFYRLRLTFKGSATTAPGRVVTGLRFTRRFAFG